MNTIHRFLCTHELRKHIFLLPILIVSIVVLTSCKPEVSKNIYDSTNNVYTLDVTLNTATDTLQVTGELSYINPVDQQDELYLHLYPNAINPTFNSYNTQIDYLRVDGNDINYTVGGTDNTLLHFDLANTYDVNERINITFSYSFTYWNIDRIVAIGDYYVTMFFYPFVPVFDQDGWNIEPYSFTGESYFNTLGDYYVTIHVPDNYLIAASGNEVSSKTKNDQTTSVYEIENARDFSFSTSSNYHYYQKSIDDRDFEIFALQNLTSSEQTSYFNYMETIFRVMEDNIGPYFYNHFTLELGYIYGMESTGIVYCDQDVQEATIVHEAIHQWFYSIIGNDQSDEPFLDEALTTFITAYYFKDLYGMSGYNGYLDYRSSLKAELADRFIDNKGANILRHISEYEDDYGYLVYYHGPTIYRYYVTLFLDGDPDLFLVALQEYYNTYKGDIATIDEFFTLLENATGKTGTKAWLYDQAHTLRDLSQITN